MFDEQRQRSAPRPDAQGGPAGLADIAVHWMQQLPPHIQPLKTAERFPRIANSFAAVWPTPPTCRAYFEQLLLDDRGNRQGFPKPIAAELAALKDYYDSVLHPTQQTVWDEILGHARG
jgi:hypothetical protein